MECDLFGSLEIDLVELRQCGADGGKLLVREQPDAERFGENLRQLAAILRAPFLSEFHVRYD